MLPHEAPVGTVDLTYGYTRGRPVIEGLTASFAAGSMCALTGPSGTGKSTLLYLLAGMLTPWSGAVRFNGVELGSLSDPERSALRARQAGFVFQDFALDPRRTILDAVLEPCLYAGVPRETRIDRALALLDRLGVRDQSGSRPGEISGGQAQRVALCRALLLEPTAIFADEPTGNLDHESTQVVLGALAQAADSGCVVLIATHHDTVMAKCHDRLVLS